MRLARRITLAISFLFLVVVAMEGYLTLHQELALIDQDLNHDGRILAASLRASVENTNLHEARRRTLQWLEEVAGGDDRVLGARVVEASLGADESQVGSRSEALQELADDPQRIVSMYSQTGDRYLTFATVSGVDSTEPLLIEVSQSTAQRDARITREIVRVAIVATVILLLAAIVSHGLGKRLVGRPLTKLVEAARRLGAEGTHREIEIRPGDELSTLGDEMNRMSRALAAARERITAESDRRVAALEQLWHAERLTTVGRMAAGVAHELGTPLNVIAARAQIISRTNGADADIVSNAKIIREQTARITRIVQRMLTSARRKGLDKTAVRLRSLAIDTRNALQSVAQNAGVSVEVDDDGAEIELLADETQIAQVLTNLVVNGIDAAARGGSVTISLDEVQGQRPGDSQVVDCARLSVHDTGAGIPKEVVDHMFDPFFTTKEVGAGTGLGLSVSLGIVQEHGGWFEVTTAAGSGTTVGAYFPLDRWA